MCKAETGRAMKKVSRKFLYNFVCLKLKSWLRYRFGGVTKRGKWGLPWLCAGCACQETPRIQPEVKDLPILTTAATSLKFSGIM